MVRLLLVACFATGLPDFHLRADEPKARATLRVPSQRLRTIALSPDGSMLASGGDGIILWDTQTGKKLNNIKGHGDEVLVVTFCPGGKTLASAARNGTVKLWSAKSGLELATLQGRGNQIYALAFTPDGSGLVYAGEEGVIKIWDLATARERRTFQGHSKKIHCLAITSDGKTLASGSGDRTIKLWDMPTCRLRTVIRQEECFSVFSLAFSPDDKTLASGHGDWSIKIWEVATCKERVAFKNHTSSVSSLAFCGNGRRLVSGSPDGFVKVRDLMVEDAPLTCQDHDYIVMSAVVSPNGKTIASASWDGTIILWGMPAIVPAGRIRLGSSELKGLWTRLGDNDVEKAFEALRSFISVPDQAIAFLVRKLQPMPEPNAGHLRRLVGDLDGSQLVVRRRAAQALETIGDVAEPALRRRLAEKPPLEVRRRIEQLLARLDPPSGESLRALRAVEVLEHIGTPEAKRVLGKLATGAEGARLTREATAALRRLEKRELRSRLPQN